MNHTALVSVAQHVARASGRILPPTMTMSLVAWSDWWGGEAELRMLRAVVPADRIAIDVGAAEGVYSYFLARCAIACHAFEANPHSAAVVRARLPQVQVHACALSDRSGEIELRIPVVSGLPLSGWATVEAANQFEALSPSEVRRTRVPCATLDSFGFDNVGFIKIDVEGHELAVLAGAEQILARDRPALLVEAEDNHRSQAVATVQKFLAPLGYRGWLLDRMRWVPMKPPTERRTLPQVNNFLFRGEAAGMLSGRGFRTR